VDVKADAEHVDSEANGAQSGGDLSTGFEAVSSPINLRSVTQGNADAAASGTSDNEAEANHAGDGQSSPAAVAADHKRQLRNTWDADAYAQNGPAQGSDDGITSEDHSPQHVGSSSSTKLDSDGKADENVATVGAANLPDPPASQQQQQSGSDTEIGSDADDDQQNEEQTAEELAAIAAASQAVDALTGADGVIDLTLMDDSESEAEQASPEVIAVNDDSQPQDADEQSDSGPGSDNNGKSPGKASTQAAATAAKDDSDNDADDSDSDAPVGQSPASQKRTKTNSSSSSPAEKKAGPSRYITVYSPPKSNGGPSSSSTPRKSATKQLPTPPSSPGT
jgi:hypothetical protein